MKVKEIKRLANEVINMLPDENIKENISVEILVKTYNQKINGISLSNFVDICVWENLKIVDWVRVFNDSDLEKAREFIKKYTI